MIEMGFKEGFTMNLNDLDNVLSTLKNKTMKSITLFANGTILFGIISILCLLALHFMDTELKPSFRMVSEYALGKHKWVLTIFFLCWGMCSISSGFMLWNVVTSGWAKFGVLLLFVTGIGAIMGGLFDVQHKLHGLTFGIGIPFLPIGALLISYHLIKKLNGRGIVSLFYFRHILFGLV